MSIADELRFYYFHHHYSGLPDHMDTVRIEAAATVGAGAAVTG